MGNPLHFIQASDTSAFAALHTEQGALPSQYEALQAYLKNRPWAVRHLWAEPVTGQATPAGYAPPFPGIRRWKASAPPLPPRRGRSRSGAGCLLRRAREAVTPSRRHARRRPAPQGAVHPSADNVFVVNGHPVLVNWGLLPQGTDEATAPILWGEPENGETPSGVTGAATAATGASAAAVAGTAARNAVPGAGRAAGPSAGTRTRRARPERRPEPPQAKLCRGNGGNVVIRRSKAGLFEPCSSASCWAYSCFSCCVPA